jgi:PKHD-type hydroxylase
MKGNYRVIKNLISKEDASELANVIRNEKTGVSDAQVPNSISYYSLPSCNVLLGKLIDKVSKEAGRRLKPTYSYCRIYLKDADLKPHKDRPSCEYSVTLNLSQTHKWPIYMGNRSIIQNPGDGVLYKGCEIEHSRKVFEGEEYIQVFLHYVDADGPHKDCVYDKAKPVEEDQYQFKYDDQFSENHMNYYRFIKELSSDLIDGLLKRLDTKEMDTGKVGDGDIKPEIRTAKIYWLPKTDEFLEIYKIIHQLVGKANSDFFNFRLGEIRERLQYTVYSSEDQGHYDWHVDMGPCRGRRKLSVVCQLSDPSEYEGGELQFNDGRLITAEKDKGTVVIFPSYLLHRVTPVTKGTRRSLVLWVEGPSFS